MKKKLFKENKLFIELHPTKNSEIDFSRVYETSSQIVFWQCNKNVKHVYSQKIRSRVKEGYGCSYCSGYRTLPEDSLAALYPSIAAEINPHKNPGFNPETRSATSNKQVVFTCSEGHDWKVRVEHRTRRKDAGCPICRKRKKSLALNHPQLLKEWHPIKNKLLDPWVISAGSNKKVWWTCNTNSEHPDWERIIAARSNNDKGCPKCLTDNKAKKRSEKQLNKQLPILSEYSKELSSQWHPSKNGNKLPSDYTAGSIERVWWLCPHCQNEWPSTISNRARNNRGCPVCAKLKRRKSNLHSGVTLVETHPELILQWHTSLNGELNPAHFTYGSAKKIWWQCPNVEKHIWEENIINRTKRKSLECKICKEEANSLEAMYPDIAAEWHPTKNGNLKPNKISKASGEMIWWQCSVNPEHQWQADVRNRTINNSKCKKCASEKIGVHLRNRNQDLDPLDVDTYHIFKTGLESLLQLLEYSFDDNKRLIQPVYRMIYSTVITALESYLSDTFLNKIKNNSNRILKIVSSSSELNTRKYSIEEIIDWQDNVETKIIEFLSNIIWHKIDKVRRLYLDVLEIKFPENSSAIFKAVEIRHDLVHRNGRLKEGGRHNLTKSEIEVLIKETNKFVSGIQKQILKIE